MSNKEDNKAAEIQEVKEMKTTKTKKPNKCIKHVKHIHSRSTTDNILYREALKLAKVSYKKYLRTKPIHE